MVNSGLLKTRTKILKEIYFISELSPLAISLLVIFLGGKLPKLSFGVANGFVW